MRKRLWNFGVLQIFQCRKQSIIAAQKTDILIVSVSGQKDLPEAVRSWLELLFSMPEGGRPALVGIFDSVPRQKTASIYVSLRRVAERARTNFFPHSVSTPDALESVPSVSTMKLLSEEFAQNWRLTADPVGASDESAATSRLNRRSDSLPKLCRSSDTKRQKQSPLEKSSGSI